jgi:hypothetical protein
MSTERETTDTTRRTAEQAGLVEMLNTRADTLEGCNRPECGYSTIALLRMAAAALSAHEERAAEPVREGLREIPEPPPAPDYIADQSLDGDDGWKDGWYAGYRAGWEARPQPRSTEGAEPIDAESWCAFLDNGSLEVDEDGARMDLELFHRIIDMLAAAASPPVPQERKHQPLYRELRGPDKLPISVNHLAGRVYEIREHGEIIATVRARTPEETP